jgi:hypothetical protein
VPPPPKPPPRRSRARRTRVMSPDEGWMVAALTDERSPHVRMEQQWGDWEITVEIGWGTRSAVDRDRARVRCG